MQIREKLSYRFITIVAILLLVSSLSVYLSSALYRQEDFYNRLQSKASITARLLIEVEEVDAALLRRIEENNPTSLPDEKIIIFNYQNEILYSSDEDHSILFTDEMLDEIRLNQEIRFRQGEYEVLGFLYIDKYDRFVVLAAASDIYGIKKQNNLLRVLLLVFGIGLLLVFISARIYAGKALQPISRVIRQVDNISASNLDQRLEEGDSKDEIAHLAKTFNNMLERLESTFKMQKNFIANASHELRTPLTVITGQLEVILMKERTGEEYRKALDSVLDDMKNLNSVSNRLLLLAQASSFSAESAFRDVRIDDLLWQARSEVLKRDEAYGIEVIIDESLEEAKQLIVSANEQLLKTAIINLLDNACKYSGGSPVIVKVFWPEAGKIQLEFIDSGIGISTGDQEHIFEPFHRGTNATGYKGHGLGLSLVSKTIQLHQGQIQLISTLGEGSTFTIILAHQ